MAVTQYSGSPSGGNRGRRSRTRKSAYQGTQSQQRKTSYRGKGFGKQANMVQGGIYGYNVPSINLRSRRRFPSQRERPDMVQAGGLYGYGVTPVPPRSPFTPAGNYGYYAPGTAAAGYMVDPRIGYQGGLAGRRYMTGSEQAYAGAGQAPAPVFPADWLEQTRLYYRDLGAQKSRQRPPSPTGYTEPPMPQPPQSYGGGYPGYGYGGGGYSYQDQGRQAPYARARQAGPAFQYAGSPFGRAGASPFARPPDWARRLINWTGIGG